MYMMRAYIVDQLSHDVILGDDLPDLTNLVQSVSKSCAVATRSQAKGLQLLPVLHSNLIGGGTKVRKDKKQPLFDKVCEINGVPVLK